MGGTRKSLYVVFSIAVIVAAAMNWMEVAHGTASRATTLLAVCFTLLALAFLAMALGKRPGSK